MLLDHQHGQRRHHHHDQRGQLCYDHHHAMACGQVCDEALSLDREQCWSDIIFPITSSFAAIVVFLVVLAAPGEPLDNFGQVQYKNTNTQKHKCKTRRK